MGVSSGNINKNNKKKAINLKQNEQKNVCNETPLGKNEISDIKFYQNPNFKYKCDVASSIYFNGTKVLATYISPIDKIEYLAVGNENNNNIDIINLRTIKLYKSLIAHESWIYSISYYLNPNNNKGYLISSDMDKKIIIFDVNNNYTILKKIQLGEGGDIQKCFIIFNIKNKDYIITISNTENYSKIFNLKNFEYIKNIFDTNNHLTWDICLWIYNNNYYAIEMSSYFIFIVNLFKDEIYAKLPISENSFCGFIYDNNFLCNCTKQGEILLWDLINKSLIKLIKISNKCIYNIVQWNQRYVIAADLYNNAFKIVDIIQGKLITTVGGYHTDYLKGLCLINHSIYGPCLLTAGNKVVKLWTLKK